MREGDGGLVAENQDRVAAHFPVVIECSGDGALLVETDYSGERVRVQLEPDALTWSTAVLADRIVRLHRAALMRARADRRLAENNLGIPPSRGWPSHAEVEEFRRRIDF